MPNNREKGSRYEEAAASFFESLGYEIIERNYRRKTGEIDLIAKDGNIFVFAEVKFRKRLNKGFPEEAVTAAKQQRIFRTAQWFLKERHLSFSVPCRFDVISILDDKITHIKNAFGGF